MHMYSEQLLSHPIEVLNYASRHGYKELADSAAFLSVDQPMNRILDKLLPNLITPWVSHFFGACDQILRS